MGKNFPRPAGTLQGDNSPIPDRGTGTGLNGDTYGFDLSVDATNRIVGITGSTRSDPFDAESIPDAYLGL